MRITVGLLLALLCVFSGANAEVLVVDTFNFGTITEGELLKHDFQLINTESYPVVVQQFNAECGCLAVSAQGRTLAPGESLSIPVEFDSTGFAGPIKRSIEVETTNQSNPQLRFVLTGKVDSRVTFSPDRIDFGEVSAFKGGEKKILRVQAPVGQKVRLRSLSSSLDIKKKEAGLYEIGLLRPLPPGYFMAAISIGLINQPARRLVPVIANVKSNLTLSQSVLPFGKVGDQPVSQSVELKTFAGVRSAEMFSVETDTDALAVSLKPKDSQTFTVEVTLDPKKLGNNHSSKTKSRSRKFQSVVVISDSNSGDKITLRVSAIIMD